MGMFGPAADRTTTYRYFGAAEAGFGSGIGHGIGQVHRAGTTRTGDLRFTRWQTDEALVSVFQPFSSQTRQLTHANRNFCSMD